jgi:hypothetical protein
VGEEMTTMSTVDRLTPYIDRLLEDEELHRSIERSLVRGQQAVTGALRKGSPKKAAGDRRVRARARASVFHARRAIHRLRRAPELERRRRRRRQLLTLGLAAALFAAGALAARGGGEQHTAEAGGQPAGQS